MLISRLAALLAAGGDNVQIVRGVKVASSTQLTIDFGFEPDIIILNNNYFTLSGVTGRLAHLIVDTVECVYSAIRIQRNSSDYLAPGIETNVSYTPGTVVTIVSYYNFEITSTGIIVNASGSNTPTVTGTWRYIAIKYT